jgi:hypothetical protein
MMVENTPLERVLLTSMQPMCHHHAAFEEGQQMATTTTANDG